MLVISVLPSKIPKLTWPNGHEIAGIFISLFSFYCFYVLLATKNHLWKMGSHISWLNTFPKPESRHVIPVWIKNDVLGMRTGVKKNQDAFYKYISSSAKFLTVWIISSSMCRLFNKLSVCTLWNWTTLW